MSGEDIFARQDLLEAFDFQAYIDQKIVPEEVCSDCGSSSDMRGCFCSGTRATNHYEPHRVWCPDELPEPTSLRAEWKFSIEPDHDKFRAAVKEGFEAKPHFVDFLTYFDWDTCSTQSFEEEVNRLMMIPQVASFVETVEKARDPVKNFCNKVTTVTPSDACDAEHFVRAAGKKNLNQLDYLCCNWFEQSLAHFKHFIDQLKLDLSYSLLRVYTTDSDVRARLSQTIGVDNLILVDSPAESNLYVFGANNYSPSIASEIRTVWGLGWMGSTLNHGLPCDAMIDLQGQAQLIMPFNLVVDQKNVHCYQQKNFATYDLVQLNCQGARYRFLPSDVFDVPYVEKYWDPSAKRWRSQIVASKFGRKLGVISSYASTKLTAFVKTLACHVDTFAAMGTDHPLLNPYSRPPFNPAVNQVGSFASDYLFTRMDGDQLCFWSLYVTKTTHNLVIRTNRQSWKRVLHVETSYPFSAHGFGVWSVASLLCNPVVAFGPSYQGVSLISCLPSKIFNAFNKIGGWCYRPEISGEDVPIAWDNHTAGYWMVSRMRSSHFIVDNTGWYSPICLFDPYRTFEARFFLCPDVNGLAYQIWARTINLSLLMDFKLPWTLIEPRSSLGKASFNVRRAFD